MGVSDLRWVIHSHKSYIHMQKTRRQEVMHRLVYELDYQSVGMYDVILNM